MHPLLAAVGLLSTLVPSAFAAPRYTLAVPNQVTAGKPLKGSLAIVPTASGSLVVSLTDAKGNAAGDEATIKVDPATTSYSFDIASSADAPAGAWKVSIAGNAGFTVAGSTKINAVASATLAKILVDKPIYKPSQTLKGRVFVLTEDLTPATATITVTAEDPEKNKMARWQLEASHGFVEFELAISDQPVLGEWTLTVEGAGPDATVVTATTETFEIAEYVLPRFAVELNVPDTISMEDAGTDGVTGDIAGVFTHGNAVVGSAVLELYAEKCRGYWCRRKRRDNALGSSNARPPHVLAAADKQATVGFDEGKEEGGEGAATDVERRSSPFGGYFGGYGGDDAEDEPIARTVVPLEGKKATFSFSVRADGARRSAACQVGRWEASCFTGRMSWGRALTVKATVVEAATGVEVDAEAEITTTEHDIDYTFGFDRRTFAPGLPITMTLDATRVIDGSPVIMLPGQSTPFSPSFKVQWSNYKCGDTTQAYVGENGCSSTYSCKLTAGSCAVTLDVPATAEFIFAKVTNADGNGNDSRSPKAVEAMWSPSNTFLRAAATAAPSTPSSLVVSLKAVTSHELFAKQIAALENSIKQENENQARWAAPDDTYYIKRIKMLEAQLVAKKADDASASADFGSIMYTLVGRGTLLASGKVAAADLDIATACSDAECNAKFTIANLPTELGSTPKLVVYFVAASGEIVSDSVELESASSLKHTLEVKFDTAKNADGDAEAVLPGAATNVKVTVGGDSSSGSTSLVGLIAVDKSVYLLRNRRALTGADFLEAKDDATELGYGKLSRTSEDHFDRAGIALITDGETHFADTEGAYIYYPYGYGDDDGSVYGVRGGGDVMFAMADMAMDEMEAAPTSAGANAKSEMADSAPDADGAAAAATAPRAYFPESWNELWTTMTIADGTVETIGVKAPDTITSWILGGYAVSSAHGVAVSDTNDLVVFQPFFIELKLPYSVIRGESFELVVAVYNYEEESSAVTVTLGDGGDDFAVAAGADLSATCAAVSKTAPCTVTFDVTPTSLGQIMFEITGQSPTKRDVVQRTLLVKAEGIERSYLSSAFMEPTAGADAAATLKTLTGADGVVEGSVRLMFAATANLMASSIEGLGSLVRQPTGCGEQNMITFAPIISVRKYFDATNTLSVEMAKKTSEYMKVGYQRELTYQRSDHGFSAFGNSDPESSLWLSAFVLRSFAQSAHALEGSSAGNDGFYIDPAVVAKIAGFVVGLQKSNGEFTPSGLVLHQDMKGGVASNGASSLAAYVTLALLEAQDLIVDSRVQGQVNAAIKKSVAYLSGVSLSGKTPYASALITFALVQAGVATDAAVDGMIANVESLWTSTAAATTADDAPANPWMYCYMTPSADVETVAYAILVMTETNRLDEAYAASKWLVEKRGVGGGWQSTQDTVVGLEALAAYSAAVYAAQGEITVTVTAGADFSKEIVLNQNNYDMLQTVAIPPSAAPSEIEVVAQGEGKCIVSVDVQWNEPAPTAVAPPIDVQTLLVPVENGGVRCEVCAKIAANAIAGRRRSRRNIDGSAATGMALVQVQPFSGWAPASMADTRSGNPKAKRVDNDGREGITFYVDSIGEEPTCVQLTLSQDFQVNGLKPVSVSVSDYYEPSVRNDVLLSFDEQAASGETILVGMDKDKDKLPTGVVSAGAAMGGANPALLGSFLVGLAVWFQFV